MKTTTQSGGSEGWDYKVSPDLIPWSSRAHDPHSEHLNPEDMSEYLARRQLGVYPDLVEKT